MPAPKRRTDYLDKLEARVVTRLKKEPAGFQDLVDEGLIRDRGTARSIQWRLQKKGHIRKIGKRYKQAENVFVPTGARPSRRLAPRRPGKPRTIWAWVQ